MKKLSLLLLFAVLSVVSAGAQTTDWITLDFLNNTYDLPSATGTAVTLTDTGNDIILSTDGNITYTQRSGTSTSYGMTFPGGKKPVLTIKGASDDIKITKVQFEVNTMVIGNWVVNTGSVVASGSDVIWTPSNPEGVSELTINKNTTTGRYVHNMTITYTKPAGDEAPEAPIFDPASGASLEVNSIVKITSRGATSMTYDITDETGATVVSTTDVPADNQIILPSTEGTYTVNATGINATGTASASATYTVYIPAPGAIKFNPASGVIDFDAEISVSADNATRLVYTINGEEPTTIEGNSGVIPTPQNAGAYTIEVTASNDGKLTTDGIATYVIVDTNDTAPFVRCLDASMLKAGDAIYIGDRYQTPVTLMSSEASGMALAATDATIENSTVTNAGQAVKLFLIPASEEGKWYLIDANNNYLYSNNAGQLSLKSNAKSEFSIEIGDDGLARISTIHVLSGTAFYIGHDTMNGNNIYTILLAYNIGSSDERTYPCLYYQGELSKPGDVAFNPNGGEVEEGTTVTIHAPLAATITYTYAGATETVDGETAEVTITKPGTVKVVATNAQGESTGEAKFTIKPKTVYTSNVASNWVLPNNDDWMAYPENGSLSILCYGGGGIAYDNTQVQLTGNSGVKYYATFQQNESNADAKLAIRVVGDEEWTLLDIPASRADEGYEDAQVNINAFNGKTVQLGLQGPETGFWEAKDLAVQSRVVTAIETIEAEADADAPVYFYNLQGVRVNADNMTPGIYVRIQGKKATKVLVK